MVLRPEGQQVQAIKEMRQWYRNWINNVPGTKPYYYLAGFAGAGKTFLTKAFLAEEGLSEYDVRLMTFMARSAIILSKASGLPAQTIHSAMMKRAFIEGREEWILDTESDVREAKLLILDECSMVGKRMFQNVLSHGRPVLVLGDPGQLQPIGDEPIFTLLHPDFFLTEIRRQALDNPIIRLSMLLREGAEIPYGEHTDGEGEVKVRKQKLDEIPIERWKQSNAVLTYTKAIRDNLNETYRQFLGFAQISPFPVAGDRVMCLNNRMSLNIANGTLGEVVTDVEPPLFPDSQTIFLDFKPEGEDRTLFNLETLRSCFQPRINSMGMTIPDPEFLKRRHMHFGYGYAMTGHKALGSQFERVIMVDSLNQQDRLRWLYTSLTRAIDYIDIGV